MFKNISNRLSEIVPAGRQTLRREIRLPILYLFTPPQYMVALGVQVAPGQL